MANQNHIDHTTDFNKDIFEVVGDVGRILCLSIYNEFQASAVVDRKWRTNIEATTRWNNFGFGIMKEPLTP